MTRHELSYDSHGINGPDEYRSRIATFAPGPARDKYGPLFEAAPELLDTLERFVTACHAYLPETTDQAFCGLYASARAAIARATGAAQ